MPPLRNPGWIVATLLTLAGLVGLSFVFGEYKVSLTQARLQDRLDRFPGADLPIKGAAGLLLESARAEHPRAHVSDGRLDFSVAVTGLLHNGKTVALTVVATGAPRYDDGAFYFDPDHVEARDVVYGGVGAGEVLSRLGGGALAEVARRALRGNGGVVEAWAGQLADAAARRALADRPVYRLKDDVKGLVLKSSLESVRVEGDRVEIVLSLTRFGAAAYASALSQFVGLILVALLLASPRAAARFFERGKGGLGAA